MFYPVIAKAKEFLTTAYVKESLFDVATSFNITFTFLNGINL